jgi:hypothetical protein
MLDIGALRRIEDFFGRRINPFERSSDSPSKKFVVVVTEKSRLANYFWGMDRSIRFLLANDVAKTEGATIHPITPPSPESRDDDKVGFTLDVAARLDREAEEDDQRADVIPIGESLPTLADSA